MENITNKMHLTFDAKSVNEAFARMTVMAFMADMNPTIDELEDVKTAVSEAVTNAIIHGYNDETKQVELSCERDGNKLTVVVEDKGVGIPNIEEARQPFYTTKPEQERSGMGFAFMEAFMDEIRIASAPGEGTRITMTKYIERDCDQ
ncbi:MAG: anti-sigma F factor [Agathobacter sp.]